MTEVGSIVQTRPGALSSRGDANGNDHDFIENHTVTCQSKMLQDLLIIYEELGESMDDAAKDKGSEELNNNIRSRCQDVSKQIDRVVTVLGDARAENLVELSAMIDAGRSYLAHIDPRSEGYPLMEAILASAKSLMIPPEPEPSENTRRGSFSWLLGGWFERDR